MSTTELQTISTEILECINSQVASMTKFGAFTEFEKVRLNRDIQKLAGIERGAADLHWALLAHIDGDFEKASIFLDNAKRLRYNKSEIDSYELQICANLLYATKALSLYKSSVNLANGNISKSLQRGLTCGAFQASYELIELAKSAKIGISQDYPIQDIVAASYLLKSLGVSDDVCAQVLDSAGEVMRSKKLFWLNREPDLYVNIDEGFIRLDLRIDATPEEATKMTLELIDKLIEKSLLNLPFTVDFLGAKI
jgi:hypothetical protein